MAMLMTNHIIAVLAFPYYDSIAMVPFPSIYWYKKRITRTYPHVDYSLAYHFIKVNIISFKTFQCYFLFCETIDIVTCISAKNRIPLTILNIDICGLESVYTRFTRNTMSPADL